MKAEPHATFCNNRKLGNWVTSIVIPGIPLFVVYPECYLLGINLRTKISMDQFLEKRPKVKSVECIFAQRFASRTT